MAGKYFSPTSTSPVSSTQCWEKTDCTALTTGPWSRTPVSRQWSLSSALPVHLLDTPWPQM